MGSKKRIFFAKNQKKIKQKWENQFVNVKNIEKTAPEDRTIEKHQTLFIEKNVNKKSPYPLKTVYIFFNRIQKDGNKLFKKLNPFNFSTKTIKNMDFLFNFKNNKTTPKLSNKKITKKVKTKRIFSLFSFYFFKVFSLYALNNEVLTLFLLSNSTQQYHLNTLGINYKYFKTTSSGKCLKKHFGVDVSKCLKKSPKLNKLFVDYYFQEATTGKIGPVFTHTLLKPLNKKALTLFSLIQNNFAYYPTIIGFKKYYITNFKTCRRIKKSIKKRIVCDEFKNKPYRTNY